MSLSVCSTCLARLRLASSASTNISTATRIPSATSSFHSSAIQQNVVAKKKVLTKGAAAPKLRESRSARINKKQKDRPKPPPVGQRRTERKRIVLSNTNALEIQGLENLNAANAMDEGKIGQVLAIEGPLLDQLREAKAFKTTQNWSLFRTPSTLLRTETWETASDFNVIKESISAEGAQPATIQKLIVGPKASGKSIHLLQAMSMAYQNKWIVINIPDCQEFVINQSSYTPIPKTDDSADQMYAQPQLASALLARLAHSNKEVLTKLKPTQDHSKLLKSRPINLKSLHDLVLLGSTDPLLAPKIWAAVWKELNVSGHARPPVLIAIDGINFWMGETKYRTPEYKTIHAHQFTLVQQFLDLVFSKSANALPNGGMVLACTTKSNHPTFPAFELLVNQVRARNDGLELTDPQFPLADPYSKLPDERVYSLLGGTQFTQLTELSGLSRLESKGLLEYFARNGVFREAVNDSTVAEKWTMSGGGIVGELCKIGARVRVGMFETHPKEGTKKRV